MSESVLDYEEESFWKGVKDCVPTLLGTVLCGVVSLMILRFFF